MTRTKGRKAAVEKKNVEKWIDELEPDLENIRFRVPENLSKRDLISKCPEGIEHSEWVDACWVIVGSIVDKLDRHLSFDAAEKDSCSLNAQVLKSMLGGKYNDIRNHMCKANLIVWVNPGGWKKPPQKKKKANKYKLASDYEYQHTKFRTITHPSIKKRIVRWKEDQWRKQKARLLDIYYLIRWLNSPSLQIDEAGALDALDILESKMKGELARVKDANKRQAIDRKLPYRFGRFREMIREWDTHKRKVSVDDAGRLYTIFTKLPSIIRNYIRFEQNQLVSYDIKNSQPLHMIWLTQEKFWKKAHPLSLYKLDNKLYENIHKEYETREIISHIITLQKQQKTQENQGFQHLSFQEYVRAGKLYEFIANQSAVIAGKKIDREKAKVLCMVMLYNEASNGFRGEPGVNEFFTRSFPEIAFLMEVIKKDNYRAFPLLLQTIEAQMIIKTVCQEIYNRDSSIPLFTVHDSIITTKDNSGLVEDIIQKNYSNLLGFPIRLSQAPLSMNEYYSKVWSYAEAKLELSPAPHPIDLLLQKKKKRTKKTGEKNGKKLRKSARSVAVPFPNLDVEVRDILSGNHPKDFLPIPEYLQTPMPFPRLKDRSKRK